MLNFNCLKKDRVAVWRKPVNLLNVGWFFTCGPRGRSNGGPKNNIAAVSVQRLHQLLRDKNTEMGGNTIIIIIKCWRTLDVLCGAVAFGVITAFQLQSLRHHSFPLAV